MLFFRKPLTIHEDPLVQAFLRRHAPPSGVFVARIDRDDEMFQFDLANNRGDRRRTAIGYYTVGARICSAIRQVADWRFGGLANVPSFLDFASGYGRSTRFLCHLLPPGRIWACDIGAKAVAFQRENYGVNGIVSVPDPSNFVVDRRFDYIFASSFFTHMPPATFGRWMETLHGLLNPGGILAFSTHDVSLIPPGVARPSSGILFGTGSESRSLPGRQYGSTHVSEEYVRAVVDVVTGGRARLHRIERGLCYFQDLYVLADDRTRDLSELAFCHDPFGHLDFWVEEPGAATAISGWAADINPGGAIAEVALYSGDALVATATPTLDRPDVGAHFGRPELARSGWELHVPTGSLRPDEPLEVLATNHAGCWTSLAFDLPRAVRARCAGRR